MTPIIAPPISKTNNNTNSPPTSPKSLPKSTEQQQQQHVSITQKYVLSHINRINGERTKVNRPSDSFAAFISNS